MDFKPCFLNRELVQKLIDAEVVSYNLGDYSIFWIDRTYSFPEGVRHCMSTLWPNFLKGNRPVEQQRIMRTWPGSSSNIADLAKRNDTWKEVIVGDGRGNYWLHIPEEILQRFS